MSTTDCSNKLFRNAAKNNRKCRNKKYGMQELKIRNAEIKKRNVATNNTECSKNNTE